LIQIKAVPAATVGQFCCNSSGSMAMFAAIRT
jgi:hypothetical protein